MVRSTFSTKEATSFLCTLHVLICDGFNPSHLRSVVSHDRRVEHRKIPTVRLIRSDMVPMGVHVPPAMHVVPGYILL